MSISWQVDEDTPKRKPKKELPADFIVRTEIGYIVVTPSGDWRLTKNIDEATRMSWPDGCAYRGVRALRGASVQVLPAPSAARCVSCDALATEPCFEWCDCGSCLVAAANERYFRSLERGKELGL